MPRPAAPRSACDRRRESSCRPRGVGGGFRSLGLRAFAVATELWSARLSISLGHTSGAAAG
jgi:hypothetical protein